jgi:uncharacterized membrane protein YdbT with pleckstrin-like domain
MKPGNNSDYAQNEGLYSCAMEPAERFLRLVFKIVLMILAFIVAFVFGEVGWGMSWFGVMILIVGASISLVGEYLWKLLRARHEVDSEATWP